MSYDLQLYRNDAKKEPLSREDLEKLNEKFVVSHIYEDEGKVTGFEVKYKDDQPQWIEDGFDISWQGREPDDDRAYYQTYISYAADHDMWQYFNDLIEDVADELHLTIVNPQLSGEDPETERKQIHEQIKKDEDKKNQQYNNILNKPAKFVFDFQIEIRSWPEDERSYRTLYANGDQMYRGTVAKGEKLYDKLKEIVPILIGTHEYQIVTIEDVADFIAKEITNNPLLKVTIETDYFDPKSRNLKYNMSWSDRLDIPESEEQKQMNQDVRKESTEKFAYGKQITQQLSEKIFLYEPAESKYFIKLLIRSWDPIQNKQVFLFLDGDHVYASKVDVDQTLKEVLDIEMPVIAGTNDYEVLVIDEHGDFDFDRHGNKVPRKDVIIAVDYFDPKTRDLKYNMMWV